MGVSTDALARYIRGENMPAFEIAARLCLAAGVSLEWLATGKEPETPQNQGENVTSQILRREDVKLAVQLAEEALDGRRLGPADYAELVALIHDALVNGLPSAQVLAFAKPAARGLERGNTDAEGMGNTSQGAAGTGS